MERLFDKLVSILNEQDLWFDPEEWRIHRTALARFKEYEDSGLEPEDVRRLQKDWTSLIMTLDEFGGMPHLRELLQAEKDGRLVVLPFEVGKKVYDASEFFDGTFHPEIYELQSDWFSVGRETSDGEIVTLYDDFRISANDFGKTVFLTREEAEAALAKKGESA